MATLHASRVQSGRSPINVPGLRRIRGPSVGRLWNLSGTLFMASMIEETDRRWASSDCKNLKIYRGILSETAVQPPFLHEGEFRLKIGRAVRMGRNRTERGGLGAQPRQAVRQGTGLTSRGTAMPDEGVTLRPLMEGTSPHRSGLGSEPEVFSLGSSPRARRLRSGIRSQSRAAPEQSRRRS